MKKLHLILLLALALAGVTAHAGQQVIKSCYYCFYTNGSDKVGCQVSPTSGYMTKSGGGTILGDITIASGKSQGFEAHPPMGWKVKSWYKIPYPAGIGQAKDGTFLAEAVDIYTWTAGSESGNFILTVFFEPIVYKLNFDWSGVDALTTNYIANVRLPSASRDGYDLEGWKTNAQDTVFSLDALYTGVDFGVTTDNQVVELAPTWAEKSYTVSKESQNCTLTVDPSSSSYSGDVAISWTPVVEVGAEFSLQDVTVYGGADSSGEVLKTYHSGTSATFNMSKDAVAYYTNIYVKAVYERHVTSYAVSVTAGDNGTVTKSPDQSSLPYGSVLEVLATANEGYAFEKWSDDSLERARSITVTGPVSLRATFTNCVYTMTFDPNGGTVVGATSRQVAYRDYVGELPTAQQYLKSFRGWFTAPMGGAQVTAVDRYEWTKDVIVYAQWIDAQALIVDVFASPEEGGVVEGGGTTFVVGDRTTLKATPNDGYSFSHWSDGGEQTHEVEVIGNAKYTATFTGKVYSVTFDWWDDEMEGDITPSRRNYTFGSPWGELPTATPADEALEFVGWCDGDENEVTTNSVMTMSAKKNVLYAKVRNRPAYKVSYICEQKHDGEMSEQTIFCDQETALTSNAFVRTGYGFCGWAEMLDKGTVRFADGEKVLNIVLADQTAHLYAVWSNNVYTVWFDGNGATGGSMSPQTFTYGVPASLPANGFVKKGKEFAGWSTNGVTDVAYADAAEVMNLCTGEVGDESITLKAVWRDPDMGNYSRAMHCTTLKWEPEKPSPFSLNVSCWSTNYEAGAGYDGSGSDVRVNTRNPDAQGTQCLDATDRLVAKAATAGTLAFRYVADTEAALTKLQLLQRPAGGDWSPVADGEWNLENLPPGEWSERLTVEIAQAGEIGFRVVDNRQERKSITVKIDQVMWMTAYPMPEEKDKATISFATVSGGKFSLSFASDERFAYNLLTNANLLITSWGVMTNEVGTGEIVTFDPPILDEQPQLFYKVETIQRQD